MDWFRSYHGAPTDPKWRVIAKRAGVRPGDVAAIWWALMDHASQQDERGDVTQFDVETVSSAFEYEMLQVQSVIDAMTDKGIIVDGRLAAWEKRQPKREDKSTERVRKFRETQRNTVEHGNHLEQRREEKIRAEKIPPKAPRKRGVDLSAEKQKQFDEFWAAWPVKQGKEPAMRAFSDALDRGASLSAILAGAERYSRVLAGPDPPKPKFPQGWLNDSRWTDEPDLRVLNGQRGFATDHHRGGHPGAARSQTDSFVAALRSLDPAGTGD